MEALRRTVQHRPALLIVLHLMSLESGVKVRDPGGGVVADQAHATTYSALAGYVARLARFLLAAVIEPEDRVGTMLPRATRTQT
jgi:hypothetical protein